MKSSSTSTAASVGCPSVTDVYTKMSFLQPVAGATNVDDDVINLGHFRERKQLQQGDEREHRHVWSMMLHEGRSLIAAGDLTLDNEILIRGLVSLLVGAIEGDERCIKQVHEYYARTK